MSLAPGFNKYNTHGDHIAVAANCSPDKHLGSEVRWFERCPTQTAGTAVFLQPELMLRRAVVLNLSECR